MTVTGNRTFPKCQLPEGSSGDWSIRRVALPARAVEVADDRPDCFRYRPGDYTELRCGGITFMTDLYDEWWTQRRAIERAREVGGSVLVTGLGLGVVVKEMLADGVSASIRRIVVLERSADVIRLAAPSLLAELGCRLNVVQIGRASCRERVWRYV